MIFYKCDRTGNEKYLVQEGVGGCNSTMLMFIFILLGGYFLLLLYHSADLERMT